MPERGRASVISREKIRDLMEVALGEAVADLAIVNGDIVNVYTSEVASAQESAEG